MEVEVKLRLPDSASLQTLASVLSPFLLHTHHQHNLFFDGAGSQLGSRRAVLRLRFYGDGENPSRCVVSLKANAVLVDGVSRVEEDEEDLDPSIGRAICEDPCLIASDSESRVLRRVKEEFGVEDGKYVCLGGFKNVRRVYQWEGLKLEVDETSFAFGTLYEIECESDQPERAKEMIEGFLRQNEIGYSYSKMSKFAIFRAGKLPALPDSD